MPAPTPSAGPADMGGTPAVSDGPEAASTDDKPFDAEPFNAGVEADEASDPKKFIEQLTGKLGQSLRKYNQEQGQPDMELEKFAINSLLSATHTSTMNPEDQNEIIKKIKTAGKDSGESESDAEPAKDDSNGDESAPDEADLDFGSEGEKPTEEVNEDMGMITTPKKLSIFAPEGSPEAEYNKGLSESKKKSIFTREYLKTKLTETFNQEDDMNQQTDTLAEPAEPVTKPVTQPTIKPAEQPTPSRRDKPFLPMPNVQPDPKAVN